MKFLSTVFLCALTSGLVAAQCDLATNVCEFTNQYLCKRAPSGIKYDNCGQTAKNNCKNGCPVTVSGELIESIYVRTYVYKPFITNGFVSSSSPSSVTLVFGMLRRIALVAVVIAIVDSRIDAMGVGSGARWRMLRVGRWSCAGKTVWRSNVCQAPCDGPKVALRRLKPTNLRRNCSCLPSVAATTRSRGRQ